MQAGCSPTCCALQAPTCFEGQLETRAPVQRCPLHHLPPVALIFICTRYDAIDPQRNAHLFAWGRGKRGQRGSGVCARVS